ncbi:phosphatase PAP2 family protein [Natrialbaceae archaeon A-gly3]
MSRGIGEFGPIQESIPEWLAVVIALLTQLGDIWFLTVLLTALYWFGLPNRDDVAVIAGSWLAGMGLYKGLKEVFGFPRPDQPLLDPDLLPWGVEQLYEATAMASGYGFPSGHAVNTTIVYFGLAYALPVSTPRRRFTGAAAIVATVGFTRVALGVHYLVDIVVGVGVGFLLLGSAYVLMNRTATDRPTVAFALAVVFGLFFVGTSRADPDAIFVLAASLGAFAGWQLVVLGRRLVALEIPSRTLRPIAIRGGAATVALAPLVAALEYFPLLSAYAAGGVTGLVAAVAVTVPVARHSPRARRVGAAIAFWLRMGGAGVRYLLTPEPWRRLFGAVAHFTGYLREWLRTRRRE